MSFSRQELVWMGLGLAAVVGAVLWPDNLGGSGPPGSSELRQDALDLCALYLPCNRGDAHFQEICKDYGNVGTTCGYLPSFVLYRLGVRDPRIVNRIEPGLHDEHPQETIGQNIARLVHGGEALGAWHWLKDGAVPQPGDVLYFGAVDAQGGISREHVAILGGPYDPASGTITTWDLGHSSQPEGSETTRPLGAGGRVSFLGSTRELLGFVDIGALPLEADADLTDHTALVA